MSCQFNFTTQLDKNMTKETQAHSPQPRSYRGKSAQERKAERKRQLIEAAVLLFGQQGFANVSIDALCAQAGLTKRYFYEAFDSREALLTAAYSSVTRDFMNFVQQSLSLNVADARKMVRAGLESTFEFVIQNPDKARLMLIEAVQVRGHMGSVYGKRYDDFVTLLIEVTRPFLVKKPPEEKVLRVVAKGVLGSIIHLCQNWIATDFKQPMSELIDGTESILGGVGHSLGVKGFYTGTIARPAD